jgi:hypothetical protein
MANKKSPTSKSSAVKLRIGIGVAHGILTGLAWLENKDGKLIELPVITETATATSLDMLADADGLFAEELPWPVDAVPSEEQPVVEEQVNQ